MRCSQPPHTHMAIIASHDRLPHDAMSQIKSSQPGVAFAKYPTVAMGKVANTLCLVAAQLSMYPSFSLILRSLSFSSGLSLPDFSSSHSLPCLCQMSRGENDLLFTEDLFSIYQDPLSLDRLPRELPFTALMRFCNIRYRASTECL